MTRFTIEEKIALIKKELTLKKALYPHRVKVGTLKQDRADYELAVFRSILHDYRRLSGE